MASKAEQIISRGLRTILGKLPNGADIEHSEPFQRVLTGLEFFVPDVLGAIPSEPYPDYLDGIIPTVARKSAEHQAEIFGLCVLIWDQTLTPIHLRLQVSSSEDEITWLECCLGERGEHGMVRLPYESLDKMSQRLQAFVGREDAIGWLHRATFGQKRS